MRKQLDSLVQMMEAGRPVGYKMGDRAYWEETQPDGSIKRYVYYTFCSDGVKEEGMLMSSFPSSDAAIAAFVEAWKAHVVGKDGWALMWRCKPELGYDDGISPYFGNRPAGWTVYSRFFLSQDILGDK